MFTIRKNVFAVLGCAIIIMALFGVVFNYFTQPSEEIVHAEEEIEKIFVSKTPAVEKHQLYTLDVNDDNIQEIIHSMSHQKVKADEKWGNILITKESIQYLLEVVKENENILDYSDTYLDILNRWYEGDFSKADKDHNAIWELQGGSIGKATGLLTPLEEQEYINNNY